MTTSGQSNLTQKGRIAATHGRFNRILQVAPMCASSNTCFLERTARAHNPNSILIGSAVVADLTS